MLKREQKERNMRTGKIARLPREIREELNRRLDNGEPGVGLIAWLNELPAVKELLQRHFDAKPINDVNLTEWKQGGFVDWQTQQDMLTLAKEFNSETEELEELCGSKLTDRLKTFVAVHYAALLRGWNGEMTDEMREQLRGLKSLSREIVRLRRSDREVERIELDREALELQKQQTEEGIRRKFEEWAAETDFREKITPKMTKEEMDRVMFRLIYGRDKEEMKSSKLHPPSSNFGATGDPSSNEAPISNVQSQGATESDDHPPSSDFRLRDASTRQAGATRGPKSEVENEGAGVEGGGESCSRSTEAGGADLNQFKPI